MTDDLMIIEWWLIDWWLIDDWMMIDWLMIDWWLIDDFWWLIDVWSMINWWLTDDWLVNNWQPSGQSAGTLSQGLPVCFPAYPSQYFHEKIRILDFWDYNGAPL